MSAKSDKERTRAELAVFKNDIVVFQKEVTQLNNTTNNNDIVPLKPEMTQLNEDTNEMKETFRHETEKLCNNETNRDDTDQDGRFCYIPGKF